MRKVIQLVTLFAFTLLLGAAAEGQYAPATNSSIGAVTVVGPATATYCLTAVSATVAKWLACGSGGGGSGTVTSISVTAPTWLSVGGSPVTTAGTIAITSATNISANYFLAAPNGSSGSLTPRAIVAADIPTLNQNTTGTAGSVPASGITGNLTATQIAAAGTLTNSISGTAGSVPASGITGNLTATQIAAAGTLTNSISGTAGSVPASGITGNLTATQIAAAGTLTNSISGTAALATALAATPGQCGGSQFATGITANGTANCATPAGGGSGTVSNSTTQYALAYYAATGTTVSSDTALTDNGTTFIYSGTGGVQATNGPVSAGGTGIGAVTLNLSSGGVLTITAAGTSASNYTATLPDATDTIAELTQAQTLTNKTYASPVFTGSLADASAVTQFKLPVAAGYTSAANGEQGYDSTNLNWHLWSNGVDTISAVFPTSTSITNADCVKWVKIGNVITLGDTACGGGSSLPTGTTAQTLYYATGGTTGSATSALLVGGATAGSNVTIGGSANGIDTLDITGNTSFVYGSGSFTYTTNTATFTSSSTTLALTSCTGLPSQGYVLVSTFAGYEFVKYTTNTPGTAPACTLGGLTRSLFGSTAPTSQATGTFVTLVEKIDAASTTSNPNYVLLSTGYAAFSPTSNGANTFLNGSNIETLGTNLAAPTIYGTMSFGITGVSSGGPNGGLQIYSSGHVLTIDGSTGLASNPTNSVHVTTAQSIATTTFSAITSLLLPAVTTSTTVHGRCSIIWEQSTATNTVQFGMGTNNAPTDLYVMSTLHSGTGGSTSTDQYTTITSTTTTAISATGAPGATATGYKEEVDFDLITGATNAVAVQLYALTGSTSDAVVIEPGSECAYQL